MLSEVLIFYTGAGGGLMTSRRIISIIIAFVVAVIVMYIGRSCIMDIQETNEKSKPGGGVIDAYSGTGNQAAVPQGTGLPQDYYPDQSNPDGSEITTENIQYVTSILGSIVGTYYVTEDENAAEVPSGEVVEEDTGPTSILDNQDPTEPTTSSFSILGQNEQQPTTVTEQTAPNLQPAPSDGFVVHLQ